MVQNDPRKATSDSLEDTERTPLISGNHSSIMIKKVSSEPIG